MQNTSSINRAVLRAFAALLRRWFAMFAMPWLLRGGRERAGLRIAEQSLAKLIVTRAMAEIELPYIPRRTRRGPAVKRNRPGRDALAAYMRLALPKLTNATSRARRARLRQVFANLDRFVRRLIRLIMRGAHVAGFVPIASAQALCVALHHKATRADTS
jgi:hypothetical protein